MNRVTGNKKLRVVKYKRVSTDEQKNRKYSIIAQNEELDMFLQNNPHMVVVGDFADEGVSGSKLKRTELSKLLDMVENKEVDLILVTKLDRWFRDLPFYYKVQEVLERNNCAWKTILEEYDTSTSDGRFKVNIMLSLAQNEIERDSERIKVVFDSKIRNKQAITGSVPFGFALAKGNGAKMVVHDPEVEHIVYDALDYIFVVQSIRATLIYINNKYDMALKYNSFSRLLRNTFLYGEYRGVRDYCPPYMTKEKFEELQRITTKNIKVYKTKRSYIFSGLLKCPKCGRKLGGIVKRGGRSRTKFWEYKAYRCQAYGTDALCDYKKNWYENTIERKVLAQIQSQIDSLVLASEIEAPKKPPRINKTAIRDEMERLNKMYQKGRIDDDEYDKQYEALEKKLYQKEEPVKDYSKLKETIDVTLSELYQTFDDKEKRMFYRSIIDYIEIDGNENIIIHFL